MTLSIIKMALVQNRCKKWKERDEISKNVNFQFTDSLTFKYVILERFESWKNLTEWCAGQKSLPSGNCFP